MNILEELKWRGLIADCTDAVELEKKISAPITLYCGFDPTADSLHVGNLVPLLALRRFQLLGHNPIAVAGGATGSIGDPSGKTQERQLLTKEILENNIFKVQTQLAKLLEFDAAKTPKNNPAKLLDNASWTQNISFLDFLRDIGKHFSVNQMVAKESVRARMEDRETGISYTEFSYMLLQAFDFYYLANPENKDENGKPYNCELQIGGSDQWGNITAGIDLIRKKMLRHLFVPKVFGLTLPLITNADGTKFGKTEAGAIWLDEKRTLSEDFYQFWIRTDDRDVIRYLKYFTFLTRAEIELLEKQHIENPSARTAHKALAKAVTSLIHGEEKAKAVEMLANNVYDDSDPTKLTEIEFEKRFGIPQDQFNQVVKETLQKLGDVSAGVPCKIIDISQVETHCPIVDILVQSGLCSSKGQARKDIQGGGIYINNVREMDINKQVSWKDFLFGKHLLLRKGKKNYVVVTAK